jgi:hypothetical protein
MPDGSMLISDDETGAIYRVTYNASNVNATTRGVTSFQGPAAAGGGAQRSSVSAVRPTAGFVIVMVSFAAAAAAVLGLVL